MDRQFITLKQCIRDSNKGFTLTEILISAAIGLFVMQLALSTLVSNRKIFLEDQARINVNQNLRAAMDLVGTDIKQAGERIQDPRFPAIEVDQVAGVSRLTLRRRIVNPNNAANQDLPILPVCRAIGTNTNEPTYISQSSGTPPQGCVALPDVNLDGWPDNLELWRNYRCSRDGVAGCQGTPQEQVRAHVYDGNGNIQPFTYIGERLSTTADGFTGYEIQKVGGTVASPLWTRAYSTSSSLYLLEERQFSLVDSLDPGAEPDILQMVIDGGPNPLRLVNQLSNFQVRAVMQDDTERPAFGAGDSWYQLKSIRVDLTAQDPSTGSIRVRNLQASARFFPRNALSR